MLLYSSIPHPKLLHHHHAITAKYSFIFLICFLKVIRQPFITDRLVIKVKENTLYSVYLNEFNVAVTAFTLQCPEAKVTNKFQKINNFMSKRWTFISPASVYYNATLVYTFLPKTNHHPFNYGGTCSCSVKKNKLILVNHLGKKKKYFPRIIKFVGGFVFHQQLFVEQIWSNYFEKWKFFSWDTPPPTTSPLAGFRWY